MRLIVTRFQRLCHVIWGIDILSEKLTPLQTLPLDWGFHAKSVFFFSIFSGDLHFDALIIGLFLICLTISQTLREVTI